MMQLGVALEVQGDHCARSGRHDQPREHIILLTKVRLVKAVVFPVFMYGCESWTIKKAEH